MVVGSQSSGIALVAPGTGRGRAGRIYRAVVFIVAAARLEVAVFLFFVVKAAPGIVFARTGIDRMTRVVVGVVLHLVVAAAGNQEILQSVNVITQPVDEGRRHWGIGCGVARSV